MTPAASTAPALRPLVAFEDLTVKEVSGSRGVHLEIRVRAYMPWETGEEEYFGHEVLDGREVRELADALDEWLRDRGYR